jgi:hypothetical protein
VIRTHTLTTLIFLACGSLALAQPTQDSDLPFREEGGKQIPLFMHSKTFDANASGWARDNVEVEAAMTVRGIDGKALAEMVNRRGLRAFKRLRRSASSEAFSLGFDFNEIPWDSESHNVREGRLPSGAARVQPYVWLTIENDKFPIHEERFKRRLALGTDTMDDIYYDNDQFLLLGNSMSIRARKRWDSDTEMRRLLIALKLERGVDDLGIKRAAKTDVREDRPSDSAITGLDEAVLRGIDSWNNRQAIPLRRAYMTIKNRGGLSSTPSYESVLALKPKAFLRSVRSRFHLNEISLRRLREVHELGKTRLEAIGKFAQAARMDNAIDAQDLPKVEAFEARVRGVLDGTLVAERAAPLLAKLGHTNASVASIQSLMPGSTSLGSGRGLEDIAQRAVYLEQRKVVAETVSTLYHELATDLDDGTSRSLRRVITRSIDRTGEDHVDLFRDWRRGLSDTMRKYRTPDKIMDDYRTVAADSAGMAAYNDYGTKHRDEGRAKRDEADEKLEALQELIEKSEAGETVNLADLNLPSSVDTSLSTLEQLKAYEEILEFEVDEVRRLYRPFRRFKSIKEDEFKGLRFQIRNEQVRVWMRQIQTAGSAARGMWFDEAREFYVPASRRTTGNFLIDTMDFASMYRADVWGDTPPADRTAAVDLTGDPYKARLIGSTLVNEVQIELNSGGEYTTRIKELESLIGLPRAFMKWAQGAGLATTPAEYKALAAELKALGDDELQARLAPLNKFLADTSAPIQQISHKEFREWLTDERLTLEVRDDPNYREAAIDKAAEGARFVVKTYVDMLKFIADLKRDRVLSTLRSAGAPSDIEWVPASGSKGSIAISAVKALEAAENTGSTGGSGNTGNLGGIVDMLTGNHTLGTAQAVLRGASHSNEVAKDKESDYFAFQIKKGEKVTFTVTFKHDTGDLDLELLDAAGDSLDTSEGTDNSETLSFTAQEDTTLNLRVYGYDGAKGAYKLSVE